VIERHQIFVNGKWLESSGTDVIAVINPATEEPIAAVPGGSAEDVDRAARAAADAFASWSQSSLAERAEVVTKLARLLEARSGEILQTIVSEVGHPASMAARAQVGTAIGDLDIAA